MGTLKKASENKYLGTMTARRGDAPRGRSETGACVSGARGAVILSPHSIAEHLALTLPKPTGAEVRHTDAPPSLLIGRLSVCSNLIGRRSRHSERRRADRRGCRSFICCSTVLV